MSSIKILMERKQGDFGFEARNENGHIIQTDSNKENGGTDFGYRPMQLLLVALGSCSAIDIVQILKKQRQKILNIHISIEGEREQKAIPSLWKTINLSFNITGDIDKEKGLRACHLSIEKYCSVAETLRRSGSGINWHLILNGNIIEAI